MWGTMVPKFKRADYWVPAFAGTTASLALLRDAVERLGEALQRIAIGRFGTAPRFAGHDHVGAAPHRVDHARLFGGVLEPGAVGLRVHRVLVRADVDVCLRTGLERIADHDRNLVAHV